MKKIKHLVLLMALLTSAVNFAQVLTGPTCSVATSIPGSGTTSTIDQQTTNGWLSFTAQSNQVTFKVNNISNGNTFGKVTKVNLYGGTCGNLSLISASSITINDLGTIDFNNVSLIAGNTYYLETEKSFNGSQCTSGACTDNAFFSVSFTEVGCGFHWGYNTTNFVSACLINDNNSLPNDPNLTVCSFTTCSNQFLIGFSQGSSSSLGDDLTQTYTLYIFDGVNAPAVVSVTNYSTVLTLPTPGTYTIAAYTPSNTLGCPPPVVSQTTQPSDICCCRLLEVTYVQPNCNIVVTPTPLCAGQPFCFYNYNNQNPIFNTVIQVLTTTVVSSAGCFTAGLPAGTYTIKVKAEAPIFDKNGDILPSCICNNSLVIRVNPQPVFDAVNATPAAGCIGETTTLTAFAIGANSYTWLPGPLFGNPTTVTITANQTYTVIAGNSGCTSTAAVSVFTLDCCKNPNAGAITLKNVTIVPYNPSSSVPAWGSLGPSATYANMSVQAPGNGIISGNYTVDGFLNVTANNILIRTANIYFTEGALVRQFQTMTIERSYLHGCLYMWRGIRSYAQLTIQSSIMEDAQQAIFPFVVNHAGIYLENNIFNINFNVVNAQGQNFATQGNNPKFYAAGNIFTSKTLPASVYTGFTATTNTYVLSIAPNLNSYAFQALKGSTLLAIPSNITANHGIVLGSIVNSQSVRVGEITQGNSPGNNLKTNYFNLLKHGVEVTNSRVNIFNCVFDNFFTGSGPAVAGVYHSGGRTQIGQAGGFGKYKCVFNRCNYGVYATNSGTLISQNNTYNLDRRSNGIEFFGGPNSLVTIINNTLTNSQLDLYSFSNANTARIVFDQNVATGTYTTGSRRHHVFINELSTASSPTYVVTTNTLTGKDIGVFMNGVNKSNVVGNTITTNILTLLNNTFYNGVEISNSADTWINDNIITNAAPSVNLNKFVEGINSSINTNNTYACNTIYNTGVSMLFRGTNPSNIYKNLLNVNPTAPCKYGIFIDNFGTTGDIKYQPTNGQSGNQFGDFDYSNGGFDTYAGVGSIGATIYYSGTNTITNIFNPWLNSFDPSVSPAGTAYTKTTTTQPNFWQCGAGIQGIISNGIPPFFNNSLNFSSNTTNALLIGRKGIHHFFKNNSVNTNTIGGANTFMASCANNCIGSLYAIDSLASSQNTVDVQSAQGLNNNFNANNIVEQTQKDFNALYCSFKLNNNNLNASEVAQLTSLAQQCPFTDGASVYQARALLTYFDSTEYMSACEQNLNNASREAEYVDNTINSSYLALRTAVYPNPAKEELFIETEVENTTLIIYSITGQIVLNEKVSGGTSSKFNIEALNNGTYLFKILDANGQLIKSDKLIINK